MSGTSLMSTFALSEFHNPTVYITYPTKREREIHGFKSDGWDGGICDRSQEGICKKTMEQLKKGTLQKSNE